jgi:hypothetical protein
VLVGRHDQRRAAVPALDQLEPQERGIEPQRLELGRLFKLS